VVTRDHLEAVREKIDDLPLAFVSPLPAEDGRDSQCRFALPKKTPQRNRLRTAFQQRHGGDAG
jgi:hypothetical protein